MQRALKRLLVGAVLAGGAVLASPPAAMAACHAFQISVSPASVVEGTAVTVTVERDAGVNPSSIDVTSIDGSARAGQDYARVQRTVSFTSETTQTFPVSTTEDTASESAETFRLHLSNPGGCAVNPNFQIGPDATVSIQDDDAAAPSTTRATTAPSAAPTTRATTGTTTSTTEADDDDEDTTRTSEAEDTTTSSIDPELDTTTSTDTDTDTEATDTTEVAAADVDDDGGGASGATVAVIVIAVLGALGAGGYLLYRSRLN